MEVHQKSLNDNDNLSRILPGVYLGFPLDFIREVWIERRMSTSYFLVISSGQQFFNEVFSTISTENYLRFELGFLREFSVIYLSNPSKILQVLLEDFLRTILEVSENYSKAAFKKFMQ